MATGRPELLPIEEWFYETDSEIVLCDPVSGEPLQPDRGPAFFAGDFRMLNGQRYLEDNADRFVTTAFWGRMEEAQDLGSDDSLEENIRNAHVAGYMLDSTTPDDYLNYLQTNFLLHTPEEIKNNIALARDYENAAQLGLGGYRDRLVHAYRSSNTPNFRFDVDLTNTEGEPVAAEYLQAISSAVQREPDENISGVGDFVAATIREEYYIGLIGHKLMQCDTADVIPRSSEVGMMLNLGMVHSGISKKLMERYGMMVKSKIISPLERVPLVHRRGVFSRVIGRCTITEADLLEMDPTPLTEPDEY